MRIAEIEEDVYSGPAQLLAEYGPCWQHRGGMRIFLIATRNPLECALATILSRYATASEELEGSCARTSVAPCCQRVRLNIW